MDGSAAMIRSEVNIFFSIVKSFEFEPQAA